MALRLSYRGPITVPLEVEGITPDIVATMALADIEKMNVYEGNRTARLADFFEVSGDPTDQRIDWDGDLRGVHWIGAGMRSGLMNIDGSAGRHLGSQMQGGHIHVRGGCGDWVGTEMLDGLIYVHGDAANLVGAAYRGSSRGMTGGTILIGGNAGNEVGHSLRRGTIVVRGDAGDHVGFNMWAGTVLVFGRAGIRHGAGMRRGTIAFLGQRPKLLPSFHFACRAKSLPLQLLLRQIATHGIALADELMSLEMDLYNGDMIEGGRGELLLRATEQ